MKGRVSFRKKCLKFFYVVVILSFYERKCSRMRWKLDPNIENSFDAYEQLALLFHDINFHQVSVASQLCTLPIFHAQVIVTGPVASASAKLVEETCLLSLNWPDELVENITYVTVSCSNLFCSFYFLITKKTKNNAWDKRSISLSISKPVLPSIQN